MQGTTHLPLGGLVDPPELLLPCMPSHPHLAPAPQHCRYEQLAIMADGGSRQLYLNTTQGLYSNFVIQQLMKPPPAPMPPTAPDSPPPGLSPMPPFPPGQGVLRVSIRRRRRQQQQQQQQQGNELQLMQRCCGCRIAIDGASSPQQSWGPSCAVW